MLKFKAFFLGAFCFFAFFPGLALSSSKKFTGTGVFKGEGRACFGKLYIRSKTLEWNTPFNICHRTRYRILEKDMDSTTPHIAFELEPNKPCPFRVIELLFNPEFPDYWLARGYETRKDFNKRMVKGNESEEALGCDLEQID